MKTQKLKMTRLRRYSLPRYTNQSGMTLIIVIVVLLALTLVGLAATDSGNLQRVMVRNNQFRLEAFNNSQSEIEAQIDFYNAQAHPIFTAIDSGSRISNSNKTLESKMRNLSFEMEVGLEDSGECVVFDNTIDRSFYQCNLLVIDSDSSYLDTSIGSDQRQTFSFYSLK